MLVYGDHQEQVDPVVRAREINRQLDGIAAAPPGLGRHGRLVAALVETGQLLQGIADEAFARHRDDRRTVAIDELGEVLLKLGSAVCNSWDSRFRSFEQLPRVRVAHGWPASVDVRVPEGFAFYAVYPEAYVEAARRLKLIGEPRVIGIRSIGTSLGAAVAAALHARPVITVRPFGNPSAREIAIDPELERELLQGDAHYVIVDEGPGQSGGSFGSVADWLIDRGIPNERIAVLPSHTGQPGSASDDTRRSWWARVQRQVGDFGEHWPELIARWCTEVIGVLDEPPRDLSGGKWRQIHYARDEELPATVPAWERRKYLVSAGGERFLVKFAGLGCIGEDKLALARSLYRDGFLPEPIGLAHGFHIERWCEGATPLPDSEKPLADIARYIGTRARMLPAASGSGASIEELLVMARRNISLEFGDERASALGHWTNHAADLERRIVRVRTDNKLDRHEWLRSSAGALIKTDALDHHQAHDLVGCQDLAWDVAGAIVEIDVDQDRNERFIDTVENSAAATVDRELLDFYRLAYLAFRLGKARLGQTMTEPAEQQRLDCAARRYAAELRHLLESTTARLGSNPRSIEGRNELLRNKHSRKSVDEEEAPSR